MSDSRKRVSKLDSTTEEREGENEQAFWLPGENLGSTLMIQFVDLVIIDLRQYLAIAAADEGKVHNHDAGFIEFLASRNEPGLYQVVRFAIGPKCRISYDYIARMFNFRHLALVHLAGPLDRQSRLPVYLPPTTDGFVPVSFKSGGCYFITGMPCLCSTSSPQHDALPAAHQRSMDVPGQPASTSTPLPPLEPTSRKSMMMMRNPDGDTQSPNPATPPLANVPRRSEKMPPGTATKNRGSAERMTPGPDTKAYNPAAKNAGSDGSSTADGTSAPPLPPRSQQENESAMRLQRLQDSRVRALGNSQNVVNQNVVNQNVVNQNAPHQNTDAKVDHEQPMPRPRGTPLASPSPSPSPPPLQMPTPVIPDRKDQPLVRPNSPDVRPPTTPRLPNALQTNIEANLRQPATRPPLRKVEKK